MELKNKESDQLKLFDYPQAVGSKALENVVVVQFGVAEHDPFIDDLGGLPNFNQSFDAQIIHFPTQEDFPPEAA